MFSFLLKRFARKRGRTVSALVTLGVLLWNNRNLVRRASNALRPAKQAHGPR